MVVGPLERWLRRLANNNKSRLWEVLDLSDLSATSIALWGFCSSDYWYVGGMNLAGATLQFPLRFLSTEGEYAPVS